MCVHASGWQATAADPPPPLPSPLPSAALAQEVVPSLIPGLVLGGLALLGFLLFVCWACISCCCACLGCCCKRCRKAPPPRDDVAATQQFISSGAQVGGTTECYVLVLG